MADADDFPSSIHRREDSGAEYCVESGGVTAAG
jgi:hypothetical protein